MKWGGPTDSVGGDENEMNAQHGHISWKQALDFAEGRMSNRAGHEQGCRDCNQTVREAQDLAQVLSYASVLPNETDTERSWAAIQARLATTAAQDLAEDVHWAEEEAVRLSGAVEPSALENLVSSARELADQVIDEVVQTFRAVLLADSWQDQALAVRGSSTAAPRILIYESEAYTVSLSFEAGPDPENLELELIGQVTPRKATDIPTGSTASIVDDDSGIPAESEIGEFGDFRFGALTKSPKHIALLLGTDRIEIGPLPDLVV